METSVETSFKAYFNVHSETESNIRCDATIHGVPFGLIFLLTRFSLKQIIERNVTLDAHIIENGLV